MMATYYGTREDLENKELFHFKKYKKKNRFTSFGYFFIDHSVFTLVNLDCKNCHRVHTFSCCEDGKPYSMTKGSEDFLQQHALQIIKEHLDIDRLFEARQNGYTEPVSEDSKIESIKTCKGNCFFLKKEENISYCSIHKYSEMNHIAPAEMKPFSCSLFPLDIIQVDNEIYITLLTPETESFSRWGTQYRDYLCVNMNRRKEINLEDPIFLEKNYRPAWRWSENLLSTYLGKEIIQKLIELEADDGGNSI
jgi:hypothetical protein